MPKINKEPEESIKNSKSPKLKKKVKKSEEPKIDKSSAKEDSEKIPAKKQITKKPKIKSNGMKKAVNLIAKQKKKPTTGQDQPNEVEDESEIREPTAEELLESEKPENVKAILTVRQKKKLKHQQRLEEQKNKCPLKEIARNQEYLLKWKNNRAEWKFEKLRQIGIQQTVFDESKISAEVWPIALTYLSGSKGAAKDEITKAAEAVIDEIDKECESAENGDTTMITSSEKYRRARELLQTFD